MGKRFKAEEIVMLLREIELSISKWTQFSLPRVYQIMDFLLLSPKIQEYMLLSNDPQLFNIPEHKIRPLFKESEFDQQIIMWKKLLNKTL